MPETRQVRWGIIGTARIARKAFVPAVAAAGGVVTTVAGRELARASEYATQAGIGRAVQGYQALVDDPDVDALYIPLPNGLHAEWTTRALRAGKAVLLSGVMMFEHLGWQHAADDIVKALEATIADKVVTYDFARQMDGATEVKTSEFASAVVDRL